MASHPRKGWEAINYFYNTNIDHQNQLYLDEPWSRPGDYVLMRAGSPISSASSSSCPDDIDAANGWDPDRHPRPDLFGQPEILTSGGNQNDPRMPEPEMDARKRPSHPRLSGMTRNYSEYRGYWLPSRFNNDGPIEELLGLQGNAPWSSTCRRFENSR